MNKDFFFILKLLQSGQLKVDDKIPIGRDTFCI